MSNPKTTRCLRCWGTGKEPSIFTTHHAVCRMCGDMRCVEIHVTPTKNPYFVAEYLERRKA